MGGTDSVKKRDQCIMWCFQAFRRSVIDKEQTYTEREKAHLITDGIDPENVLRICDVHRRLGNWLSLIIRSAERTQWSRASFTHPNPVSKKALGKSESAPELRKDQGQYVFSVILLFSKIECANYTQKNRFAQLVQMESERSSHRTNCTLSTHLESWLH